MTVIAALTEAQMDWIIIGGIVILIILSFVFGGKKIKL